MMLRQAFPMERLWIFQASSQAFQQLSYPIRSRDTTNQPQIVHQQSAHQRLEIRCLKALAVVLMVAVILVPAVEVVAAMPVAAYPAYTAAVDSQDWLLSKHHSRLGWKNIYHSPLAVRTEGLLEAQSMTVVAEEHRLGCCQPS